ncbi:hypothetical protein N0B16_00465 [Chryseobacterium sp. GMJ5]|uniref:LysM domain-containing protein n=1 Tax=Chryseobacterium gilvum TaxID=2976534 RepID=A0ABT2VUU8_9FLAO|nr:hypothetical protein [Chryseobacterium gilvum]MCU7612904.1 hypothetical protein [Chryseobacterium gilvum]
MYNIENGDTLQSIKVTGNADVSIRTKTAKLDQVKKEDSKSESSNKIEDFARGLVNESNFKKAGKEINTSAKKATTTGTFWSFGLLTIFGVVSIVVIGLIIYFKR